MAKIYVIKGTAIVMNTDSTATAKRIVKGSLMKLNSPNHTIDVYASINSISHSFSTKRQFTIMSIDLDETIEKNTDELYGVISTNGVSFQPTTIAPISKP